MEVPRVFRVILKTPEGRFSILCAEDEFVWNAAARSGIQLLRHSREMTQVCSPEVTLYLPQKPEADAGCAYPAEMLLPAGKSRR
jgi:hypothetical protein